ncbi:MAG: insulinase family protein [Bacteroidetes bacterium]|nr:insulinase family protein [Bacteroidota bacterium]
MKKIFLLSVTFSAFIISAVAQPQLIEKTDVPAGKVGIAYKKYKLTNGLTVLLHEDHSDPIVNVAVTYKVGSYREDLGKSGFAHFFEHMMFQGSKHIADEEHFKIIQTAGGNMNGFTEHDKTTYFETLPSNYLETALWLEADRMGFLLDSLYERKFENQRDAVKNEKSQNVENQPYALGFEEEINELLYPAGHPYSWPVIGYTDDLNRASMNDVRNFFLRWYGPNNAILAVSGDFDEAQALKWIDKYYGTLKQCPEVKKVRAPQVVLPQDKYGAYRDRVFLPLNLRVYPTVPQYHRDEAALDLLADMFGSGKNSLLYKNFVKNEKAATAFAQHSNQELSGEFQIGVIAYPPDDFNYENLFGEIDKNVKATLDEFEKTGITDDALQRAKAKKITSIYDGLDGVFQKSLMMSEWERLLGKNSSIQDEIDRYNKVTKEDITRVFSKYIKSAGAAILNTYPIISAKDSAKSSNPYAGQTFTANPEYNGLSYQPTPDGFDRGVRPVPGAPKIVKVPDYFQFALSNGIKVIGTSFSETPIVQLRIEMDGGELVNADSKKTGIASLTANMMNESTKNYTSEQVEAELDKLGSDISFSANKLSTVITVSSLKENLDATMKILEEKLFRPAFKEDDFKRLKKEMSNNIQQEAKQPEQTATKLFDYVLYGETPLGLSASVKSVDKISLQDVKDYYEKNYTPTLAKITVVGDVNNEVAKQKLDILSKWPSKNVTVPAPPAPVTQTADQFYIYDMAGAPSTVVYMGYASNKYEPYGDFFKNRIVNFAFGGNFNSRINLNLREEKGYTYGIRSAFSGNAYTGKFLISSSVKRKSTALSLAEIMKEMKNYNTNGITDKELEYTKNSMLNQEAIKYESSMQKLFFLSDIVKYNLEKDYTQKQNDILKGITKEEANAQIKKYMKTSPLNMLVVGDKMAIDAQLKKYAAEPQYAPNLSNIKLKKISD